MIEWVKLLECKLMQAVLSDRECFQVEHRGDGGDDENHCKRFLSAR
jgi:hypothetical protein